MGTGRTPEEAARGDIPERFAKAIGVAVSPDEQHAFVMLATNETPTIENYFEMLVRNGDWWESIGGSNALSGWMPLWGPDGERPLEGAPGALLTWGSAPAGSRAAIVEFEGREYEAPVVGGYYFLAIWNVPEIHDASRSLYPPKRFT